MAIRGAPAFFGSYDPQCTRVTPMLANVPGTVLAGNFRDEGGNCYVWLNLRHVAELSRADICKAALHELGHLAGKVHSDDHTDVMYSPFVAEPTPAPCRSKRR